MYFLTEAPVATNALGFLPAAAVDKCAARSNALFEFSPTFKAHTSVHLLLLFRGFK